MIDTHAHLDFDRYAGEVDDVVARAEVAGVTQIITVGTSLAASKATAAIAARYPSVYPAVGIHPDAADSVEGTVLAELRGLAKTEHAVAIGETGIDLFHKENPPLKSQRDAFLAQADIAAELGLPLIVHTRAAASETLESLHAIFAQTSKPRGAVVHCFEGSQAFAGEILKLGLMISFTATLTYPRNDELRSVAAAVPLERIMLETDAPFLPPQTKRGQRNEPAYVVETARCLADLKGISYEELDTITTRNARTFFNLDSPA